MKNLLLLILSLWLTACASTKVIRDNEYKFSEAAFKFSDPAKALEEFPKKEHNGFITSIEKSWIGFWNGATDQQPLLRQAQTLDDRKYTSVSREAEYFFLSESEEGYIPAEHEIIVLHLLNSMYFMRNEKWSEARVEAKKAAYFLQSFFSPEQKHFDDPGLRIWLASVWTALGEWDEAQVDLRRAYELSHDKDILPLLQKTTPPKDLSLVFDGSGPEVQWNFGSPYPKFKQQDETPFYKIHFSTLPWFQRHQERNSVLRDEVISSNYMAQYYGVQLDKGREKTIGFVSANTIRAAGLVAGAVIIGGGIYLLAASGVTSGGGDAIGMFTTAGILVGGYLWNTGDRIASDFDKSVKETEAKGRENLKTYRFVRFLPSWISVTDTVAVTATGKVVTLKSPRSRTTVQFVQKF